MVPWYKKKPGLYETVVRDIERDFPTLAICENNGLITIEGILPILAKDNREIDKYKIAIVLLNDYPSSVPYVFEIGNRLIKDAEHHFYSKYKNVCLFIPEEKYKYYNPDASISDFINGPVKSFFLGQTYYEIKKEWPFGQRGHDEKGIYEYYSEILNTNDKNVIVKFIDLLSKQIVKGHWNCFCGSEKKLRSCCMNTILKYRKQIDPQIALRSLSVVLKKL